MTDSFSSFNHVYLDDMQGYFFGAPPGLIGLAMRAQRASEPERPAPPNTWCTTGYYTSFPKLESSQPSPPKPAPQPL